MGGRNDFQREWGNQTDIGRHFGMTAVALGRFLIAQGLRDPVTKQATSHALDDGYAKATPLKDGTPFFLWNRQKLGGMLKGAGVRMASPVEYHTKRVYAEMSQLLRSRDDDDGSDKMARYAWEMWPDVMRDAVGDAPKDIRDTVSKAVIALMIKNGLIEADDGNLPADGSRAGAPVAVSSTGREPLAGP